MRARRVTVVASEVLGVPGSGGPGTADSLLAVALARHGHDVELLVVPGRDMTNINPEWRDRYARAGVRIRRLSDTGAIRPAFLAPAAHVYAALRDDPPDVVVADDWRATGYAALRARQAGSALVRTPFVVYCHGPARVFAAAARKVPDTVDRFGEEISQRACIELADAIVSPSAWLVTWLRRHAWSLPASVHVIQNLWESVALDERVEPVERASRVERLAFFGQLREGKGIRVFLDSLRRLDPRVLDGVEVVFLGHSRRWTEDGLRRELDGVTSSIRVETQLDRTAAVRELRRPGTLVVTPSLLENSPYAVAECLEHGIPFVAADVGGTSELVAPADRSRVLRPPTADAFATALREALELGMAPAQPARAPEESLSAWLELIETIERQPRRAEEAPESIVWADEGIEPDDALEDVLRAALAASGADVVTCAVRTPDGAERLFLGDPGPLGLIENHYGLVGVARTEVVAQIQGASSAWAFFARAAIAGARIISVPDALATAAGARVNGAERLAVLEAFEQAGPEVLEQLPQLTATLAAAAARADADGVPPRRARSLLGRLRLGSS